MSEPGAVLVDIPADESVDVDFLESLGHSVIVCHGPPPKSLCPILAGKGCPKADGAHGVVFLLDLDRPQHRAILKKYKESLPEDVPITVRATPEQAKRYADLQAGLEVWTHDPGIADLDRLAAEVEAADQLRD
ncbi:MAG: hypothetical protein ACE5F5_00575 [Acidimicrobiia bacterium]